MGKGWEAHQKEVRDQFAAHAIRAMEDAGLHISTNVVQAKLLDRISAAIRASGITLSKKRK